MGERMMKRDAVEHSGIFRWPLFRQLGHRTRGTGVEVMSDATRALHARTDDAEVARSVCPYCGVGCGQLIHHRGGRVLHIEGDPGSPINQGTLCPKGAASRQLLQHEGRALEVRYRRPFGTAWEALELDRALDMIADRVWETRRRTFVQRGDDGTLVNHTTAIAHLGGATLDDEENYLIRKLFGGGIGMVAISNQARI